MAFKNGSRTSSVSTKISCFDFSKFIIKIVYEIESFINFRRMLLVLKLKAMTMKKKMVIMKMIVKMKKKLKESKKKEKHNKQQWKKIK